MAGGLDHLVIVARDLDAQAELYQRLGFQVGAQNRHDWGTLNRIVQFDGCFLELLTTEPGYEAPPADAAVSQFAGPLGDYLSQREGLAMMVLEGFDAKADHEAFSSAGVGSRETFYFERQGKRPAGEAVKVAFSLAFAKSEAIKDAGFFVCQQHAPEMFWNPAFQEHLNGTTGIHRIVFVAAEPAAHDGFFSAYTGSSAQSRDGGRHFPLARGAVDVMTPASAAAAFGADMLPSDLTTSRFAAIEFSVANNDRAVAALVEGDVAFKKHEGRVVVAADAAMGVTLAFSEVPS